MNKILLIEDDREFSKLYSNVFSVRGLDLVIAEDGEEGLAKVDEIKPDLIILDISLPKLDGFQVLLRLKSNAATKDIPVIMLTNMAGMNEVRSASYIGAIRYLVKSEIDSDKLITEVMEILNSKK